MFNPNALIPELSVSNLNKSLDFYINFLFFKVEYQRAEDQFAMVSIQGSQLMLEELNGHWQTGEMTYPFGRGINFQMVVNNIDDMYESLRKKEYPIKIDLQENWYRADESYLGQKEFLVMDPDGYLLRFVQSLGVRGIGVNE